MYICCSFSAWIIENKPLEFLPYNNGLWSCAFDPWDRIYSRVIWNQKKKAKYYEQMWKLYKNTIIFSSALHMTNLRSDNGNDLTGMVIYMFPYNHFLRAFLYFSSVTKIKRIPQFAVLWATRFQEVKKKYSFLHSKTLPEGPV